MRKIQCAFFDRDAQQVAIDLIGKVLVHHAPDGILYSARIIETESYHIWDKGSHASLGRTPSREPLFMAAGAIYMYYSRGGDSFNISCRGEGNAVLAKSGIPWHLSADRSRMIRAMQNNNPIGIGDKKRIRAADRLCAGQTLLCRSMRMKVPDYNGRMIDGESLYFLDARQMVPSIIQTRRLGIPVNRDPELMLRFIDAEYEKYCTSRATTKRGWKEGKEYYFVTPETYRRIVK